MVTFAKDENVYSVLRRLRTALPQREGALVSNSAIELALFSVFEPRQTVYQIVHDAYNLGLAERYERVVDVFIAHSQFFYHALRAALPHRTSISTCRAHSSRAARWAAQAKAHSARVRRRRLWRGKACSICRGSTRVYGRRGWWWCPGPYRRRWLEPPLVVPAEASGSPFLQRRIARSLALCAEGDVLVFPTRFEGFPLALIEAMSAGLVSVVSDLPSGIPEVVDASTGFRVAIGDIDGFVAAIIALDRDRDRLEAMSRAARERARGFDVRERAPAYHAHSLHVPGSSSGHGVARCRSSMAAASTSLSCRTRSCDWRGACGGCSESLRRRSLGGNDGCTHR